MQLAACISQCTPPTAPVQSCNLASRPRRRRLVAAAAASGGDNTEDIQDAFKRAAAAQQALEEYRLLMQRPDDSLDLVACTSLIARHRYPLLDHAEVVEQLDDLAVQVQGRLPAAPYPLKVLQTISKHLYEDRGFRGNTTDYYSPDNSCINKVLQSRQGLPISLSLVYMEVARRVGVPMVGVNIPAHFFISPADPQLEFLVDPFGGSISFLQDAEETLARIAGTKIVLDPAFITAKQPMPPRVFLARWLNNLAAVYANVQQDWASAYAISQYMLATRPGDVDVLRDSGVLLYRGKRFAECIETFREYLARAPSDSEDAERIRAVLRSLEQQD